MATKASSATTKNKPLPGMNRTAIDTSGSLGTLYDGYQDQVLGKLHIISKESCTLLDEYPKCTIKSVDINQSPNLLELIDFEEELRLSILLNLTSRNGLASLIDHPGPINEHTRLLYYTFVNREERVTDNAKHTEKWTKLLTSQTNATHIITSVRWGISFVSVLQLPPDAETVTAIDTVLNKLQAMLNDDNNNQKLDSNDLEQLKKITATTVYSNIPALARMTTISDIYNNIQLSKNNCTEHCQISYTLQPIQSIYTHNSGPNNPFICMSSPNNQIIEKYYLDVWSKMKYITGLLGNDLPKILSEHFKTLVNNAYIQWLDLKKTYAIAIEQVAKLVIDIRCGQAQMFQIDEVLNGDKHTTLKKSIDDLYEKLQGLEAKGHFISDLQQDNFQYWNVAEFNFGNLDGKQAIEEALLKDLENDRILCSTDILKNTHLSKWNNLHRQLFEEHHGNPELRLIYADFTYCSSHPSDIIILPLCKMTEIKETDTQNTPPQSVEPKPSATPPSPSSTDETINILLLGENGVGKSTFINAFANYLTFDTMADAESKKPIVLIPVSFLMTSGDNFTEHIIKLSVSGRSDNEDFKHLGQSVTQHCRSYVFNHKDGKTLRIIDTPGFGDTRGLDQDDLNLQHILDYVNNLTHLNAICFLLKPNSSRLNIFFRTCLIQLLDLLGPNARQNIIFCFTNARSTFYTPGNTGPLLKGILTSLPMNDIPFKKENTFCFDSESFRYLLTLQSQIPFNNQKKQKYETSWLKSVREINRFISYVCGQCTAYRMHDDWKSVKHAQLEIICMIRPMLEAMRNILRNIILCDMDSKKRFIKLCPKAIYRPFTICLSRKREPTQVANFWILPDIPLGCLNKSRASRCTPDEHLLIDYILDYDSANEPLSHQKNGLLDQLSLLQDASAVFSHFLMCNGYYPTDEPFLTGLNRMIDQEKKIGAKRIANNLNQRLSEELEQLKYKFERHLSEVKQHEKYIQLTAIYRWIPIICNNSEVYVQMAAVKKGHKYMMQQYEYEVSNDPTGMLNTLFTPL